MESARRWLRRLDDPPDPRFDAGTFLLALLLRVAFLAVFIHKRLALVYGQDLYYSLALSWLGWEPKWPVDATHPPVYTALIAALLGLFRTRNPLPVLALQTLLSAAAPALVRRIGGRLASRRATRLAALWVAIDPALIFFTPHLQTETVFVFMELVFFYWLYARLSRPAAGSDAAAFAGIGALGGVASLCRSVFAAYPVFLGPALVPLLGFRRALVLFAAFSIGWLAPIGAWTARNWVRYHRFIPISAQMGWTLYEGFTLDREEVRRRPAEMTEEWRRLGLADPIERSRHFKEKTFAYIRESPPRAARIMAGKAALYWRPFPYDPYTGAQRLALGLYYCALFALGLVGILASWNARWLPVYALLAYTTAVHSVFFTSLRYRMPLEPFLCLLAAVGAVRLLEGRDA